MGRDHALNRTCRARAFYFRASVAAGLVGVHGGAPLKLIVRRHESGDGRGCIRSHSLSAVHP